MATRTVRQRCATTEVYERLVREDPNYLAARIASENHYWEAKRKGGPVERAGITTIPVVVHVVFNKDVENVSDEQVHSQIAALNRDYRAANADLDTVPEPFKPLIADARIEFALATTDPGGAPTTGITRTKTEIPEFTTDDSVKSAAFGGADAWPTDRFLNIWVCPLVEGRFGYAPPAGVMGGPGDGVVIDYTAFGTTGTAKRPTHLGRTAVHEVGHWLNLRHLWGADGDGCNGDDYVDDTPRQAGPNIGSPVFPHVTCDNGPNGDLFMNYMDTVRDQTMVMFTKGQVERMHISLNWDRPLLGRVAPRLVLEDFGYSDGWRVDRHPRFMADTTADRRADIVGFGDAGVYVARAQEDGSFSAPQLVLEDFGYSDGWRVDRHPRFMADTTNDKRADIVGFGDAGVYVARAQEDGSFAAPQLVVEDFGYNAGGWRVDRHPRFMADTTNDGRADVVGFGEAGVYVARAQEDGSFAAPQLVLEDFVYSDGWRVDRHPRFMADTTADRRADIVGFGDGGVWIARAQEDGSFSAPQLVIEDFGYNAGDWRVEQHPRFMADTTADGRADIVGFGYSGVLLAPAQPDGSYPGWEPVVVDFGYNAGGWRVDRHPRFMADTTADGRADIVGFGDAGVYVARAQEDGSFSG